MTKRGDGSRPCRPQRDEGGVEELMITFINPCVILAYSLINQGAKTCEYLHTHSATVKSIQVTTRRSTTHHRMKPPMINPTMTTVAMEASRVGDRREPTGRVLSFSCVTCRRDMMSYALEPSLYLVVSN